MQKRALFIINRLSGNYKHLNITKLEEQFRMIYQLDFWYIDNNSIIQPRYYLYEACIICGGDGTLNYMINIIKNYPMKVYYYPSGTFNEFSKNHYNREMIYECGQIGNEYFMYVSATGSFTPIGYNTTGRNKKRFKIFAYFLQILKEYRVHEIAADVYIGDKHLSGHYTLMMVIDSKRCFGFPFNKMYRFDDHLLHLLLIKKPTGNKLKQNFALFFLFFRAFFIGFKKPCQNKYLLFQPASMVTIKLDEPTVFCTDGEKKVYEGIVIFQVHPFQQAISLSK